jgi:putative SOS response-associated peptidase YedK
MCGRYVLYASKESLIAKFKIDEVESDPSPSYNIAPTQEVPAIIRDSDRNRLVKFHWGLVPFWAKDKSIGSRMINARIETIADKPVFRAAFKKRRCLIPADGFYEWKGGQGHKQPYLVTIPSDEPFAFGGLWESWEKDELVYKSCTIITTESSPSVQEIHNRMPVILSPESQDKWMDTEVQNPKEVMNVLENGMMKDLKYYPVSTRVNSVKNNDPACMEPLNPSSL